MRLQLAVIVLLGRLAWASSARQLSAGASLGLSTAAGSFLQGRRLAGNGGGKGGRLNNLGLVISSKSSLLASLAADRIRAIDAKARHLDHDDAQFAGATPTALELLQQLPNRKLAEDGGGKGGTLNNLGMAVATRSSLFSTITADRIHAIDAKARGEDEVTPSLLPADLAVAGGGRRLDLKAQVQRVLLQAGGLGGGGGFGGGGAGGGILFNSGDITGPLEQRKADSALHRMINQAVSGDLDVMAAVTARRQGIARAWEMSLGRDRQQQLNGNIAGRKLRLS